MKPLLDPIGEAWKASHKVEVPDKIRCDTAKELTSSRMEAAAKGKRGRLAGSLKKNRVLALLLLPCMAHSAQLNVTPTPLVPIQQVFSWSAPTAYSDGTALPASDIWFYTLSWQGATSEGWSPYDSVEVNATTYTVPMYCGVYSVTVSVTTTVTATEPFSSSYPAGPIVIDTGVKCPPDFEWIQAGQ